MIVTFFTQNKKGASKSLVNLCQSEIHVTVTGCVRVLSPHTGVDKEENAIIVGSAFNLSQEGRKC